MKNSSPPKKKFSTRFITTTKVGKQASKEGKINPKPFLPLRVFTSSLDSNMTHSAASVRGGAPCSVTCPPQQISCGARLMPRPPPPHPSTSAPSKRPPPVAARQWATLRAVRRSGRDGPAWPLTSQLSHESRAESQGPPVHSSYLYESNSSTSL